MKRRNLVLTLLLACLLTVCTAGVQAATWTFTPELKRLDASGAELPEGEAKVSREDLRVGLYVKASTDGVDAEDDSALGFESVSGAIHFSSEELGAEAIGAMLRPLTGGGGWMRNPSANTTFDDDSFLGPPSDSGTDVSWLFFWLDIFGTGSQRGAWCVPSGEGGSCEIFLGVLEVPLGSLPTDASGRLTLGVGSIDSAREGLDVKAMHNRATANAGAGNSISYNICPVAGCGVTASFAAASYAAAEGESVEITVTLDPEPGEEVTIPIRATGASADLYELSAESLTFGPGESRQSFMVTAVDDEADRETVNLTLAFGTLPAGVRAGGQSEATVALGDNDDPGVTVTFGRAEYAAMEGGAAAIVTVSLSSAPEREVTIPITVEARGGASPGDYSGVPATVTFGADETEQRFSVTAVEEDERDRNESLALGFGELPAGVTAGATARVAVMLLDNDVVPGQALVVMLGTPSGRSVEEGGLVTIPVTVHPAAAQAELTVTYGLSAVTASAADYEDETGGSVVIGAGESEGTIRVGVTDDELSEGAETFRLTLTGVVSSDELNEPAELGSEASRAAELTILASDPLMVSLSGPARVGEGRTATYTVSVEGGASTAPVTVELSVGMGSTADAEDYGDIPGSVTVPAGGRQASFGVEVVDDGRGEGEQYLVLEIAGVEGGGGAVSVNPAAGSVRTIIVEVDLDGRVRAMTYALAGFGRILGEDVVEMVGERAAARGAAGSYVKLAGRSVEPVDGGSPGVMGWVGGGVKWLGVDYDDSAALARDLRRVATTEGHRVLELPSERELMSGSAFRLVLNQNEGGGSGKGGEWALWGRGGMGGFDGRFDGDFTMEGEVSAVHLGLDYRMARSLLVGVAVSRRQGVVEYEVLRAGGSGDVDMDLNSVHPYLHWSPSRRLSVWGSMGTGQGGASLSDDGGSVDTDVKMFMAAAGTRGELLTLGGVDLALKADVFQVRLDAEGHEELPETKGEASRLRLALDGRKSMALGGGARLTGAAEFGVRLDGGDAETGLGTELGASVGYAHPAGLNMVARGRVLLGNGENEFDQWGASVEVTFDPAAAGRGLQFKLVPSYGRASSGMDALWNDAGGADALLGGDTRNAASMMARVGYGLDLPGQRGVLTPFGEMDLHGGDPRRLRLGVEVGRWRLGRSAVALEFYGERKQTGGERAADRRVVMNARWNF